MKSSILFLLLVSTFVASCDRKTDVVIKNVSNSVTHAVTGKMRLDLDGIYSGEIQIGEETKLRLSKGPHKLTLTHYDIFKMESDHPITVGDEPIIIEAKATAFSNSIKIRTRME
jgi:hypothetical protein